MTFLYPPVFLLLLAVAVPITIHILSNTRRKKVEFSSIRFIKNLEKSSLRNIKLRKIALLITRILFIIFLVLMMSRPVTRAFLPGWLSARQDSKVVVILDNSASMSAKSYDRSNLEISKNLVMTIMPLFEKETKIIISQTCPPKVVFSGQSDDPSLRNAIKAVKPSSSHDDIWLTINGLIGEKKGEPIKECIVFSDLMYSPDSLLIRNVDEFEKWKFYFIKPKNISNNLGILNVTSLNRIKTLNKLIKLNARVKNSGQLKKPNVPLELEFNKSRVGQVISEFSISKEKEFLFQAYPSQAGILECKVLLPEDDYNLDNAWHLVVPIMNEIRCAIISSEENDVKILKTILKSIDPQETFLKIETKINNKNQKLFLEDSDLAIIYNLKGISKEVADDLDKFLKSGRGIIWFQGSDNKNAFHSSFYSKVGFPEIVDLISVDEGFFDTNVPIKRTDLFEDIRIRNFNSDLPEVYKYIKTKPNSKYNVHLTVNNNDPLLLEFSRGSGEIFYFSSLMDLTWSDFPIRGMVVPILYRIITLLGTDEINTSPVLVDEEKWIAIEEGKIRNRWEVLAPSGKKELIVPDYDLEKINIKNTNELGIYRVYSNGDQFTSFPTRLHYREYISESINQNDLEKFIKDENIRLITMDDDFAKIFSETRHGKSLWKIFLLFALIMFLIETLLGRTDNSKLKVD